MPEPTDADLREIEAVAAAVARRAGALMQERFRSALDVAYKDQHGADPVTEVDRAVEAMISETVEGRFPAHGLLGEEGASSGPAGADYVWVVDPLDGTANFINGLPLFACSIGVLWRGRPAVAALYVPTGRRLASGVYHARRGGGAFFDGDPVRYVAPQVRVRSRLSAIPAGKGGVTGVRGRRFGVVRTPGSIACELALTAEGTFHYCLIEDTNLWDVVGGTLLCLEAGAAVAVRVSGARGWAPLERFVDVGLDGAPDRPVLRAWRGSVVAGDPAAVPAMVEELAREQRAPAVLRRLFFGDR